MRIFLAGSLPHKFIILIVTSFICLWSINFSLSLREIRPGSTPTGAPNAGGAGQNRRLSTSNRLYLANGTR